ncbi:MAG: hypothetical protein ACXVXQ_11470, partial [Mycobacteriaceae bacterium]
GALRGALLGFLAAHMQVPELGVRHELPVDEKRASYSAPRRSSNGRAAPWRAVRRSPSGYRP